MRVQEYKRAEVTAFLALIFALLVSFAGGLMESASLQSAKSYRRADMNRAMESVFAEYQRKLLEEFDLFALDGSYESDAMNERAVFDRLSYYGAGSMSQRILRIELLSDHGGLALEDQIARYMEHKYGLGSLDNMLENLEVWNRQDQAYEEYETSEELSSAALETLLSENEAELPDAENPLSNIKKLQMAPLVDAVMRGNLHVSEKAADVATFPSGRTLQKGEGDFTDVAEYKTMSNLTFGAYVLEHFKTAVEEEDEPFTGTLDYEVEYLLAGKSSDRENLEQILKRLLAVRLVTNYACIQGSAAKRAQAEALAVTLATAMALPVASEMIAQAVLFAWAFGESILDLRSLMSGYKVPLIKTEENWQLALGNLTKLGTSEDSMGGANSSEGLAYKDYIRALMYLENKRAMLRRCLDVIEWKLRTEQGLAWFRIDHCISKLEIESTASLRRGITYRFETYYGYR